MRDKRKIKWKDNIAVQQKRDKTGYGSGFYTLAPPLYFNIPCKVAITTFTDFHQSSLVNYISEKDSGGQIF